MSEVCGLGGLAQAEVPKLSPFLSSKSKAKAIDFKMDFVARKLLSGQLDGAPRLYGACDLTGLNFPAIARCGFMGAYISGDLEWFGRIRADVAAYATIGRGPYARLAAELTDAWMRGWLHVRTGYPAWLLELDFTSLPEAWRREALAIAARALSVTGAHVEAEYVARTALALPKEYWPFPERDIGLCFDCAFSCVERGDFAAAERWYAKAFDLGESNGFALPFAFAEVGLDFAKANAIARSSDAFKASLAWVSDRIFENFLEMRNLVCGRSALRGLTRREFLIAQLLARKTRYRALGDRLGLSVGRVRNLVSSVYEKLQVHSRIQLKECVY